MVTLQDLRQGFGDKPAKRARQFEQVVILRRQIFALSADVWRPLQQVVKNGVQTSVFDANFDVLLLKLFRMARYCTTLVCRGGVCR